MIPSIVSVVDFSRFGTLVDIGGGLGSLLSSILEKYSNLHGILFDLQHVIENAKLNPIVVNLLVVTCSNQKPYHQLMFIR